MQASHQLTVLHIIEGRFFPGHYKVHAECTFAGTSQTTPSLAGSSPVWNHEFKWKLPKKILVQLRSEKVPIKLSFVGVDSNSTKHNLGYLVFSLRDGGNNEREKWHSLLKPPAELHGSPPQVKILFRICLKEELEEALEKQRQQRVLIKERKQRESAKQAELPEVLNPSQPKEADGASEEEEEEDESSEGEEEQEEDGEDEEEDEQEEEEEESEEEENLKTQKEQKKQEPHKKQEVQKKQEEHKKQEVQKKQEEHNTKPKQVKTAEGTSHKTTNNNDEFTKPSSEVFKHLPPSSSLDTANNNNPSSSSLPKNGREPEINYRISVELKTIKEFRFNVAGIYFQYSYPLFAEPDSPVYTHPPFPVQATSKKEDTEYSVPNSFCMFDFATTPQFLQSIMHRVPLIVEVKDKGKSTFDKKIGIVTVDWKNLLMAPKIPSHGETLQAFDSWIPIRALEDENLFLGLIRVILTLQDRGLVSSSSSAPNGTLPSSSSSSSSSAVSIELEKWKRREKEKWKLELSKKEEERLNSLESEFQKNLAARELEWKHRWNLLDKERKQKQSEQEVLLNKKHSECIQLEQNLKQMLAKLEKREQTLVARETELSVSGTKLHAEYDSKMKQLEDLSNRSKVDLLHHKELEGMRTAELEKQKSELEKKLHESENRYRELDKEFQNYKQRQHSAPEAKLQAEVLSLSSQKIQLEKQLEQSNKKREQLKKQLNHSKEEISRLQQSAALEQQDRIKKEQKELESLRLKYLAKEHSDISKTEIDQLKMELRTHKLREELQSLGIANNTTRMNGLHSVNQPTNSPALDSVYSGAAVSTFRNPSSEQSLNNTVPSVDNEKIERLMREKENLLKTGFYNEDSKLIQQLNRAIDELRNPQMYHNKK